MVAVPRPLDIAGMAEIPGELAPGDRAGAWAGAGTGEVPGCPEFCTVLMA